MSKVRLIWTIIGVSIVGVILIGAVVWGYMTRPTDAPCRSISYIIKDRAERLYLTESELDAMLAAEDLEPVGKSINRISLHRIEKAIVRHPMVRTAECYLTPRQEVRICLTQRVPLMRVQTPGDSYFIDSDRKVMPVRAAVKDSVLLCTGAVGVQMASRQLADFAKWLQTEPYWQARIHHVQVQNPQMVYLYLKGNQPRIVLGSMRGYEGKLKKLRTFLENGADATKDKNYYELDLRYKGQVIGRFN